MVGRPAKLSRCRWYGKAEPSAIQRTAAPRRREYQLSMPDARRAQAAPDGRFAEATYSMWAQDDHGYGSAIGELLGQVTATRG